MNPAPEGTPASRAVRELLDPDRHARPRRLARVPVVVVRLAGDAHQERDGALAPSDARIVGRLLPLLVETQTLTDLALVVDLAAAARLGWSSSRREGAGRCAAARPCPRV